jgi:hypothetical protein
MNIDAQTLMAYADGELDPLAAKRVERAIAADPALAVEVEQHRALRARLIADYAPIAAEPVPDRLVAMLRSNVVALPDRKVRPVAARWREALALAACLVLGVTIGLTVQRGPVTARDNGLYATGGLASALDNQLGGQGGAVRVAVSFHDAKGTYCRVFTSQATDGIACRDGGGWALRQTRQGRSGATTQFAQAGSADPELMAAAQEMMAGDPLDARAETAARDRGWR